MTFLSRLWLRVLLWRCSRGKHAKLDWRTKREKPLAPFEGMSQPMEMIMASGMTALMDEIGWCPRCGRPIEWLSRGWTNKAQRRMKTLRGRV